MGTKKPLSATDQNKSFNELLDLEDRKYLLKHGQVYEAANGTILCHEKDVGGTLFVILQGEVDITKESDGKSKVIGSLGAGELFGEISALLSMPRIATVVANKPSIILEIKVSDFVSLLEKVPNLKNMVYKKLSERSIQTTIQHSRNN